MLKEFCSHGKYSNVNLTEVRSDKTFLTTCFIIDQPRVYLGEDADFVLGIKLGAPSTATHEAGTVGAVDVEVLIARVWVQARAVVGTELICNN